MNLFLNYLHHKYASDVAQAQLDALLQSALNGNKDDYLVFLDLLEEQRPEVRSKLNQDLNNNLKVLSEAFPDIIRFDEPYFEFKNNYNLIGIRFINHHNHLTLLFPKYRLTKENDNFLIRFYNSINIDGNNIIVIKYWGDKYNQIDIFDTNFGWSGVSEGPTNNKLLKVVNKLKDKFENIHSSLQNLLSV